MSTHTDLAKLLDEQDDQILPAFKAIDSQTMIYADGGWTLKDIIVHITVWDEQGVNALLAYLKGQTYPVISEDLDTFNNRTVQERKHLSAEDAYAFWQATRDKIKDAVERMSPEQIESKFQLPWGEEGNVSALVKGLIWHANEHYQEVLEIVERAA